MYSEEQLFEALRKADEAGNTEDARKIAQMIETRRSETVPQPYTPTTQYQDQDPDNSISTDDLRMDPDWVAASKIIYQSNRGEAFPGTDDEAADYGIDQMGWFNYNLPAMALDANKIRGASQEEKDAFLYLMDAYDDLGISWDGTWRFLKGVAADPTTYVGLSTFGLGTAAAQGGKQATKVGLKTLLKAGVRAGTVAAIEGGIYSGIDNTVRQSIEIDAGRREEYDLGEIGKAVGMGVAIGGALGGTVGSGAHAIGNRGKAATNLVDETEQLLARGAGETPHVAGKAAQESTEAVGKNVPQEVTTAPVEQPRADLAPANDNLQPQLEGYQRVAPEPPAAALPDAMPTPPRSAGGDSGFLNDIVDNIRSVAKQGPVAVVDNVQSMEGLRKSTTGLARLITASARKGEDLGQFLTRMEVPAPQLQRLKNAAQQATDGLKREAATLISRIQSEKDPKIRADLRTKLDQIDAMAGVTDRVDTELSTQSGRDLRMRQEGLNVGELRGVSVKSLMESGELTRDQAEKAYAKMITDRDEYLKNHAEMAEIQRKIDTSIKDGDYAEVMKLKKQLKTVRGKADAQRGEDGTPIGGVYRAFNRAFELVAEIMISMVFSPSTLIVNTIPSFVKVVATPIRDMIVKDAITRQSIREVSAAYSAMASVIPSSLKAAVAAYRYEKSLLLNDENRILERGHVIPKKYLGGVLRFFPRVLQATDEMFSQIAYRGYIAGRAAGVAHVDGVEKGLEGAALTKHVKTAVKAAVDKSLSKKVTEDQSIVDALIDQAMDRGLSGAKANAWVRKELNKNKDVLARAENEGGKDFVRDLLFKREFSGKGALSNVAKEYEKFVQRHPVMRVAGQLFFRTPVRVFEEGIRMTPGLNLVSPNFMRDLRGINGSSRQIRAQGEALLSYGFAGAVVMLYAQGAITGGGPTDFRQRRQGEDTPDFEPYTITLPNGDKWSYRNLDPLSTPLKIIVNGLERYEVLQYRIAQGEHIHDTELEMALAYIKVGTGAVAQALRDASLTQGIDQIMSGIEMMISENDTSGQLVKFVGQKINTLIPNTWYKSQMIDNPVLNDPATLEQFLRTRINPSDPKVPKMFTALGRERSLSNPGANMIVFDPSTAAERERNVSEKEQAVDRELFAMSQIGDTSFQAPYKHRFLGERDLRLEMTKDGKEPLYNRWMRYTRETDMIDQLHRAIVETDLPYGTPRAKGARIDVAKSILNSYRDLAMIRLISEETGLPEVFVQQKVEEAEIQLGRRDLSNLPFSQ